VPVDSVTRMAACSIPRARLQIVAAITLKSQTGATVCSHSRWSDAIGEGFAHFFAATLFNDATRVAPPEVDACTFVYYKSVRDEAGQRRVPPYPISCSAADKWRNRRCADTSTQVVDPELATERDWLQFFWAWHTTSLHNDIGELYEVVRAAGRCSLDNNSRVDCRHAETGFPMYWDWPHTGASAVSLREGVISKASGGLSSTQVDEETLPDYADFVRLSDDRGVSRNTTP
jgi:hypothetical protein